VSKGENVIADRRNYIMRSFMIFTSHQILLGWWNRGKIDSLRMQHALGEA
jgi:hypothetical protein